MSDDLFSGAAPPASAAETNTARDSLRARLAAWASQGIYLGTSSWKYPGWLGSVYSPRRYEYRGRFSDARFQQKCLQEYAELFPTVGVDATYYSLPTREYGQSLAEAVPPDFQFSFKATDLFTVKRFPPLPRHGERAGQANPHFLDAERFGETFLRPLDPIRAQVGVILFEFSRFYAHDFAQGREFVAALDRFLSELPPDWRYGVEIRNRSFLRPEFFACLRARRAGYVFNQWSSGASLSAQLAHPEAWTASFAAARLLTRPGTNYEVREEELAPFDRIREPFPEARQGAAAMIREAMERQTRLYLYVGNKLEGSAPASLAAIVDDGFAPAAAER